MKKIILGIALMSFAVSCKKIQPGSNKGVLKMEAGVERYNDDVMSDEASEKVEAIQAAKKMPTDSTKVIAQPAQMVKKDSAMEVKVPETAAATEKK